MKFLKIALTLFGEADPEHFQGAKGCEKPHCTDPVAVKGAAALCSPAPFCIACSSTGLLEHDNPYGLGKKTVFW